MPDKPASDEIVIKEYPNTTRLLEEGFVVVGNLILTNRRLVFLRQTELNEKEGEELQKVAKENNTERLIQFALTLHKRNFQIPLSSVITAKLSYHFVFPSLQTYMRLDYKTASKKDKSLYFHFTLPIFKRLLMSEFPTLGWVSAIKKALKAYRRTVAKERA